MSSFKVEETTIADIHAAYKAGTLTCVALTQLYLDRIAAYDQKGPALNSYVTLNPAALERAAELDAIYKETGEFVGPLHGVPLGIKDQAETKGIETSFGSAALKGYIPTEDATIVTKLYAAGAILLGKTTMPDFAASWWGEFDHSASSPRPAYRSTRTPPHTPFASQATVRCTGSRIARMRRTATPAARAAAPARRSPPTWPPWAWARTRAARSGCRRAPTTWSACA